MLSPILSAAFRCVSLRAGYRGGRRATSRSFRSSGERPLRSAGGHERLPGYGPARQEGALRRLFRRRLLASALGLPGFGRSVFSAALHGMVGPHARLGGAPHPPQAAAAISLLDSG